MKVKHLFTFGAMLLVAGAAFGQSKTKHVKKSTSLVTEKVDYQAVWAKRILMESGKYVGPLQRIEPTTPIGPQQPTGKTQINLGAVPVGTASNAYTILQVTQNQVYSSDQLGVVGWGHRQNIDIHGSGTDAAIYNGFLRTDFQKDGDPSWTIDKGPFNNRLTSNRARYPQVALYNPAGNTDFCNARVVWHAATTNGNGWDNYQWGIAKGMCGTVTSSQEYLGLGKIHNTLIPGGLVQGKPGEFWLSDRSYNSAANVTLDSVYLFKGVVTGNNDSIVWAKYATFRPGFFINKPANNGTAIYETNIGFSPDGRFGWFSMIGIVDNPNVPGSTHPTIVLYKTEDYGVTWTGPIKLFLRDYKVVTDAILTEFRDSTGNSTFSTGIPYLTDHDIAVDFRGNPHIFATIFNAADSFPHPDSVGYYQPGGSKAAFDITSYDGGATWCPKMIAEVNGAVGASGDLQWSNYTQIARDETGHYIFYSWSDDTSEVAASNPNTSLNSPDLWGRSFHIDDEAITQVVKWSDGDPTWAKNIIYPTISPTVRNRSGVFQVPTVFLKIRTNDTSPVDFFYIPEIKYTQAMYEAPATDVQVVAVTNPVSGCNLSTGNVSVEIKNVGSANLSDVELSYTLTGPSGNPITVGQPFTGVNLAPGASTTLTFTNTYNISNTGAYCFTVKSNAKGDYNCQNNIVEKCVNNISATVFSTDTLSGCGEYTINTGLTGVTHTWTVAGNVISGNTSPAITVTTSADVSVSVDGSSLGCSTIADNVYVNILDLPTLTLAGDTQICQSQASAFKFTANTNNPADQSYVWKKGISGAVLGTSNDLSAATTGQYTVYVTKNSTGCVVSKTVELKVWNVAIDLGKPDSASCNGIQLDAGNAGANYVWYYNGSQISTNSTIFANQSGKYSVIVNDPLNCKTVTDSINLTVSRPVTAMYKITPFPLVNVDTCTVITLEDTSLTTGTSVDYRVWYNVSSSGRTILYGSLGTTPAGSGTQKICLRYSKVIASAKQVNLVVKSGACVDTADARTFLVKVPTLNPGEKCIPTQTDSCKMSVVSIDSDFLTSNLQVYPNPNNGTFVVEISMTEREDLTFDIYDLRGIKVMSETEKGAMEVRRQIDISHLPQGIYILKAYTKDGVTTRRIIKQ